MNDEQRMPILRGGLTSEYSEVNAGRDPLSRFTAWVLYLGIVLVPNPLLFNIRIAGTVALTPVRCILLMLIFLFIIELALGKPDTNSFRMYSVILIPAIAMIVLKVASLLYSNNVGVGIQMIEWLIEAVLISFFYFYYYKKQVISLRGTVSCLFAGFAISLVASILQIASSIYHVNIFSGVSNYILEVTKHPDLSRTGALSSLDMNVTASYISSMIMLVMLALLYVRRRRSYILLVPVLGLAIIALAGTQSFTGLIALGVSLALYIVMEGAYKKAVFIGLCIVVVVMLVLFQGSVNRQIDKIGYRYRDLYQTILDPARPGKFVADNVSAHLGIQEKYIGLINEHPSYLILGCGEGAYLFETQGSSTETSAHNAYLLILAENGFLGLLLLLYISWKILKESYGLNRRSRNFFEKSLFYSCVIFVLSLLIYGSTFTSYYFWMIIGLTFAASKLDQDVV
ncbi:MAG: O-antigen ligase family protein [Candidatus Geothermincolia bacterium]